MSNGMTPYGNYNYGNYGNYGYNNYGNMLGNPVQPQINAKVVNDFSEITANDVPMNTPFSVFVKPDYSEVVIKKWNGNGTIDNCLFKPSFEQRGNNSTPSAEKSQFDAFTALTDTLTQRFDALEQQISQLAPKTRTRKEVVDVE